MKKLDTSNVIYCLILQNESENVIYNNIFVCYSIYDVVNK